MAPGENAGKLSWLITHERALGLVYCLNRAGS